MPGFLDRFGPLGQRRISIGKALQDLSSFGMKYDDMLLRNSQGIGVMEDKVGYGQMNPMGYDSEDYWYPFAALSMADTTMRKSISFFDQSYLKKREELRNFAMQDEVEEILDTLCDEAIVYDDKNFFAHPSTLGSSSIDEKVIKNLNKSYNNIYNYFGFTQDQSGWYYFRKWLIDGYLSFEIVYSDDQTEIIGFKELDPVTLIPAIDKKTNKKVWYQYKDNPAKERKFFDSQIIYISYGSISTASRVSYTERLIRAFNLMRIMEVTRVIWAVMNSSYRMKFIIPVGGKSKTRAKQSLAQLMNNYREVVDFDFESGDLQVDGKPMMAFNKEYWMPSKEGETPEIETLGGEGPDLNDTDALKYFADKLKMASKIPFSRFDKDSPATYEMSAEGLIREEIKFEKFINRLRSSFQEILVKPLYLQMILKHPELKDDVNFKNQISLRFQADNMFAELKQMEIVQKRVDFIASVNDSLVEQDADMNDIPYFPLELLIDEYMHLDPTFKEKLKEHREKEEAKKKESGEDSEEDIDLGF
tara:strand:+ start:6546 stop:8138 length:1593 start_codon:yes stop_codon:yes gene_type:complete